MKGLAILSACLFAWVWAGPAEPAELLISEFLADNRDNLADEDGDYPDWIEIYNPGPSEVDLAGWHLTDSARNLAQWTFPSVRIRPKGFLLVFASGKDRRDPAGPLHTNFRLSERGEYLALVAPDGRTVVSEYAPAYPRQVEDASFGIDMNGREWILVGPDAEARIHVPADGSLGTAWIEPGFDDGAWTAGPFGIGYDRKTTPTYRGEIRTDLETAMYRINATAFVRIRFAVDDPSAFDNLLLRMKYDDGFVAFLNGTEIARRNAPETLAWDAAAPAARSDAQGVVFEEIDVTVHLPRLRSGTNVLAFHLLNRRYSDSDVFLLPELRAMAIGELAEDRTLYFADPSPGKPNRPGVPGIAEEPCASHAGGAYPGAFLLELTVTSPLARIRYTLDGKVPTEISPVYTGPILISKNGMVVARTYEDGFLPSPPIYRTFMLVHSTAHAFSSDIPIVLVNTNGQSIVAGANTPVHYIAIDKRADRVSILDPASSSGYAAMHIRGSSSQGFPKKFYSFEVRNAYGEDMAESLLGLPADADWVLYGPYSDKSLMRNVLAYAWSNWIGRYAPRTVFCELFIVTSGEIRYPTHYLGLYVLIEKITRGPHRVDIQEIFPSEKREPGTSGGYIFRKDRLGPGEVGFTTSRGTPFVYDYPREKQTEPKQRVITPEQAAWLKGYLDKLEAALYGANYRDPNAGYAKYLDPLSFVDHHILVELTKNIDGFRLSTFYFKDREGRLNAGPIWDYNLSLGNANYLNGWLADGWYYTQLGDGDYPWWRRLFSDPAFTKLYEDRWFELREGPFALEHLLGSIDENAAIIREAQKRNFQKWVILGQYVWPNWYIAQTWEDEVAWMRNWTRDRVLWFDSQFITAPRLSKSGGAISPGFELSITSAEGTAYYTVNGPDPADYYGGISPAAKPYAGPIVLNENSRVRTRARAGGAWSALVQATFTVGPTPLVITELMYNPPPPPAGSPFTATDFEFVELQNIGERAMTLAGVRFAAGITFQIPEDSSISLGPGEFIVIAKNPDAFATRYPVGGYQLVGPYEGNFSDRSERVELRGPIDETILNFTYRDTWYPETDGLGRSLVIRDPLAPPDSWGLQEGWRASTEIGGSPGRADPEPPRGGLQLPGDASQNDRYDIADAIQLLGILLAGVAPPCEGEDIQQGGNRMLLDVNGSGQVDLADAIALLSFLFSQGPEPALGIDCVPMPGCPDVCSP